MKNLNEFCYRPNLKKVTKKFNTLKEFKKSWSREKLEINIKAFYPDHQAISGRNRVSTLLNLRDKTIEADEIRILKSDYNFGNHLTLFYNATSNTNHGFGTEKKVLFTFKDKKNKHHQLITREAWDIENCDINTLKYYFGYELEGMNRDETTKYYQGLIKYHTGNQDLHQLFLFLEYGEDKESNAWVKLFKNSQYKLTDVFSFTEAISFNVKYIKETKNILEFGFETNETYVSLPVIIKIKKVKDLNTVSLKEIKVSDSGYYSHNDNMRVKKEQLKEAVSFKKYFNNQKTKQK